MQQWSGRRTVLVGGSIAGTLDISFALCFGYFNGVSPQRLLQTVASGLLGEAAYSGGLATAALGLGLHFFIAFLLASIYFFATRRILLLTRNVFLGGSLFGIAVFLVMRLVVLPLSAFPHPVSFKPLATALDLLSHMLLFGIPIALAARQAAPSKAYLDITAVD